MKASAPEDTHSPFEFSYDYTRKDYSDWSSGRVIAPFPGMGVEAAAQQDKPPVDPAFSAFSAKSPSRQRSKCRRVTASPCSDNVDLTEPYVDFHSKYELKNNVLTATRRLTKKQNWALLQSWADYRKFSKAVADDWGAEHQPLRCQQECVAVR